MFCVCAHANLAPAQDEPLEGAPPVEEPSNPPSVDSDKAYTQLVELAQQDFEAKRYDDALTALDQAYRIKPSPNLIYNKARILEAKGDLEGALTQYEAFAISPDVDLEYRKETLERIRVLKEVLALKDSPKQEQSVAVTTTPPVTTPPVETKPRPLRRVGATMMGLGG